MSNTVTNILTINGTEEQVAEVRNFIKGSRGKSISLQSIYPMPKKLKGKREVERCIEAGYELAVRKHYIVLG